MTTTTIPSNAANGGQSTNGALAPSTTANVPMSVQAQLTALFGSKEAQSSEDIYPEVAKPTPNVVSTD